jgi:hypothetical protein
MRTGEETGLISADKAAAAGADVRPALRTPEM